MSHTKLKTSFLVFHKHRKTQLKIESDSPFENLKTLKQTVEQKIKYKKAILFS
jgi:hypothetical protein